ncbi:beta-glucosidase [Robertkochia aurantiaca]|uniref:beta-glucosidase n=1 Tax=Robertkochia aurantiaca TaxID=2873700 RepID=UPI001CCE6B47|nr:glycoside hydrolase family 3 protein [Robertkochia sp. 3YJGBD-33]
MRHLLIIVLMVCTFPALAQTGTSALIDSLTLEEKIYLLTGTGMDLPGMDGNNEPVQATVGTTKDKVPGAAGTSYNIKRLSLPSVVFADGPAGIRISPERESAPGKTFYATAFPTATSLAASWNTTLAENIGKAFGEEAHAYGVDFLLAPALNIHRNPLGGRNFEYYSEDPVISGNMAGYFVRGVQSENIGATLKHFVANNSETNRTALNTIIGQRTLREIYLRGFKIAIDIGEPWAIMSSYNRINGTFTSESHDLLTKLLREEWNYQGFVMTDWYGGRNPVAQIRAGNDLLMPGTPQQRKAIQEALEAGELDENVIDKSIMRILNQYKKTYSFNGAEPSDSPNLQAHAELAKKAAIEGMVLLKNENALPVNPKKKIALMGITSYQTISGGTGSGDVNKAYMVSVSQGLYSKGFVIEPDLQSQYEQYIAEEEGKIPPKNFFFEPDVLLPEMPLEKEQLRQLAKNNDMAVFTLGRTSGEFQDLKPQDFELRKEEKELIKNISEAFRAQGKKFVVIINSGAVIETASWKSFPDAIIMAWQPGQEAGHAVAELISGTANPSGKLPTTFPVELSDHPSTKNFPGSVNDPSAPKPQNPLQGQESTEIYEEGLYIGYRYFNSVQKPVSFPFGYGLSYTTFETRLMEVKVSDNDVILSYTVKNTGDTPGKEVIQVYLDAPKGVLSKPKRELKAFDKTPELGSEISHRGTIRIPIERLAFYNADTDEWILEGGSYEIGLGKDVETIIASSSFQLEEKVIRESSDLMAPEKPVETFIEQ